ncbi:helix-turn-helix transcriptional regulator [Anaerotignum lactatifermentans]|uniref:Helix-turn-helix transcriptional regulator n=1 Tax=Anaerotignum lactatifermentans TaxID=160404 RepID=A0ABS2GE72_9FIRM|nr:autorepressor SdpR family transcription factor [Anaerotignum lactatifermentans]MBM6830318.1 helix-turn-helix transcriptional regulator [Anaerotignum lactatifermentans]MBM6878843.1 helix-turn-helix transcriptional regulator [Anaerotignum lactatifermentans]MBM6951879.1 helix-turn-helix transcriptional regulator [Anaerotignum lactatifermentans]
MGLQETWKALGDETRREILRLLRRNTMTAGEIGRHFSASGATISHHLSVLKEADLVSDRREGKYIYYELNLSVLEEVLEWVSALMGGAADERKGLDSGDPELTAATDGAGGLS